MFIMMIIPNGYNAFLKVFKDIDIDLKLNRLPTHKGLVIHARNEQAALTFILLQ